MKSSVHTIPFEDLGPTGRYWLGAFEPHSTLHRFLPVGPLERVLEDCPCEGGPDREGAARIFEEFNLPLSPVQQNALERLADPRSLLVVTGQQPGLAGGPLYTFNKILSAIVFARRLEERWNRPVLPVLWDGGEDHDWAEINHLRWLSHTGEGSLIEFPATEGEDRPAFSIPFGADSLERVLGFLRSVHPATEFRNDLEHFLSGVIGNGTTWTDYFDRFWLKIFEKHPLLVFRPWEAGPKRAAIPLFEKEIEAPDAFQRDLLTISVELEEAGYKPHIHKKEGVCSFFYWDGDARRTVIHESGAFLLAGTDRAYDRPGLLAELRANPTAFSPNALLRPVMQDLLLPTAATVLGPSEIAYHAQLRDLYTRHEVRRPHLIPRLSLTLMFPKHREILEEFGVNLPDLLRDDRDLLKQIVRSDFLDRGLATMAEFKKSLDQARSDLLGLAAEGRDELENPIQKQFGAMEKTVSQIEDLLKRQEMKNQSHLQDRLTVLKQTLTPAGGLQERIYGVLPFMARYGRDWVDPLVESAATWDGDRHYVHLLGGENE